jgi:carbon-monoxide dehydrogenase iron sulfur subunit
MVDYDKDKCVGCWMCVMSCPFGAIRPNRKTKKVVRCDLCSDVDTPRCAKSCPVKAIVLEETRVV